MMREVTALIELFKLGHRVGATWRLFLRTQALTMLAVGLLPRRLRGGAAAPLPRPGGGRFIARSTRSSGGSGRHRDGHSTMPEIARQASLSGVAGGIPHKLGGDGDKLATLCSSQRP